MISFKNKEQIEEWVVNLENHVTMLKANLECEERKCKTVDVNTNGFNHKSNCMENIKAIKDCASMINGYLVD